MRKLVIGAVTVLAVLLGAPAAAEAAAAAPQQTTVNNKPSALPAPFDLPGGVFCNFYIHVVYVADNEKVTDTKLANGDNVEKITGKLVLSFTNTGSDGKGVGGKSIVENVSGPTTTTTQPDGSGVFEGTGNNWNAFGPGGKTNTGEPGLVFTSGKVSFTFTSDHVANNFSLHGHQVNGCDLLS